MSASYRSSRIRDFLLVAVGGAALFLALVLVLLRIKFPGTVESQLGAAFWGYLGGAAGVAVVAGTLYALSPPPR